MVYLKTVVETQVLIKNSHVCIAGYFARALVYQLEELGYCNSETKTADKENVVNGDAIYHEFEKIHLEVASFQIK
jgi:hypothetical protein